MGPPSFRDEDAALLARLEDEELLAAVFRHHTGGAGPSPHPRAAGMITLARQSAGSGGDDVARLARFLEEPPEPHPPVLVHHVALYFAAVARALETSAPDAAAVAWTRSLGAFAALAAEHTYLASIEEAVVGAKGGKGGYDVALEMIDELGRRASGAARDLSPAGRAALLALARAPAPLRAAAARRRNAAIDAALAAVGEGLEEATVRGDLAKTARAILVRARDVWQWSDRDEAVEHYLVDALSAPGWEMYRARSWSALRELLEPFRPLFESLANRIERDPAQIAYAAPCAQMHVFMSDVETVFTRKVELAERAVRLCPTHRNGRLVLALLLCEQAEITMRAMVVFARKHDVERVEKLLARAAELHADCKDLPGATKMFDRVKRGKIVL